MKALDDASFRRITSLMHESIGLSFSDSKRTLIASRLSTRIQRLGLDGYDDYCTLISGPDAGGEFQMAVDLLTTNETYFFREPAHFQFIEQELQQHKPRSVAVWSAASSFGDEAFSSAMLLAEQQDRGVIGSAWSVLGTDISDRVLRSASEAVFPQDRLRHVTPERLRKFCLRGEGDFEGMVAMVPRLRERVSFGQLNLCLPVDGIGPFDIVFLRNVLIYFDAPTKSAVVDRVLGALRPGGLFFMGTAEGRVSCQTPLKALAPGVFRKVAA